MAVLDRKEPEESPLSDLHAIASELGIEGFRLLRRDKLIDAIVGDSGGNGASGGDGEPEEERPRQRRSRRGARPPAARAAGAAVSASPPRRRRRQRQTPTSPHRSPSGSPSLPTRTSPARC